jgi:hypothetical protein
MLPAMCRDAVAARRAAPLYLLLALLAAAPAGAAPTWLEPVSLSTTTRDAYAPQVAVDPQGDAVAVWRRSSGTGDRVQSATRPAGGAWQAPVDLSAPGAIGFDPQVAVDRQGGAVAVWQRYDDADNLIVQGATRPAGGAWQAPVDLSAGSNAADPQVAVDPRAMDGNVSPEIVNPTTHAVRASGVVRIRLCSAISSGRLASSGRICQLRE